MSTLKEMIIEKLYDQSMTAKDLAIVIGRNPTSINSCLMKLKNEKLVKFDRNAPGLHKPYTLIKKPETLSRRWSFFELERAWG